MNPNAPVIVVDLQTGMFDGRVAPPLHDAEGLVARVRKILSWARGTGRGVAFISEPKKQPWGEYAMFKDPDGNQFVLSSS